MEILIVSGIWPPEVGGPASHGPEFGRFLLDRGHRVRAVTTTSASRPRGSGLPAGGDEEGPARGRSASPPRR